MISLETEKIIILLGMLLATLACGMLPRFLVKWSLSSTCIVTTLKWRKAISLLTCFSGGVFVAACFLDLIPDVEQTIGSVLDRVRHLYHREIDYPVAQFVIVFGFFLVLIVEQLVLEFQGSSRANHGHSHGQNAPSDGAPETDQGPDDDTEDDPYLNGLNPDGHTHEDDHALEHSSLRSLLLLVALSFHSLFEGLAIGLQETRGQLISIFVAVIVHKGLMAFSLGVNLAQANRSRKLFLPSILIFSAASPIGMGIGIGLTGMEPSLGRDLCNGILQGLAAGTFLYITFFEVLPHELKSRHYRILRVLSVLIGFLCICGLLIVVG